MVCAVALLALLSLTASTNGCSSSIPTSEREILSYYRANTNRCKGGTNGEPFYSENKLLADCNEGIANITLEGARESSAAVVARCALPNGNCSEEVSELLLYLDEFIEISLPKNSTNCLFAACFGDPNGLSYPFYYVNLTKCTAVPVSTAEVAEYTTATPTNYSTSPQATTGAVDPIGPTNSTAPQATRAIISTVLVSVFITAILILVVVVVAFRCKEMRNKSSLKLKKNPLSAIDKFDVNFQPVIIEVCKMSVSQESIHSLFHKLYGHTDLHVPDGIEEFPLTVNNYYQQSMFNATTPAKVQNGQHSNFEPQEEVGKGVPLSSVDSNYYQNGKYSDINSSNLEQSSWGDSNGIIMEEFDYTCKVVEEDQQGCPFGGLSDHGLDDKCDPSFSGAELDQLDVVACSESNTSVNSGQPEAKEDQGGCITNEQQDTDNLLPATLTGLNVDSETEMLDSYGGSMFWMLGGDQDILKSGNIPRPPCDNDLTEQVQDDGIMLFIHDNGKDSADFFMPQSMDPSYTSSDFIFNDVSSNQYHPPPTDSNAFTGYIYSI